MPSSRAVPTIDPAPMNSRRLKWPMAQMIGADGKSSRFSVGEVREHTLAPPSSGHLSHLLGDGRISRMLSRIP
jgi:hypothetical protein